MRSSLKRGELEVEYMVMGDGPEVVLCFHGFGRSAEDFEVFKPLIRTGQRLLCIQLFGHGRSVFPENREVVRPLKSIEWRAIVEELLNEFQVEKFGLIGYSMGARVAMMTLLAMPERTTSLLLLAPDGFKKNLLYLFASGTAMGRALYRLMIRKPWILFGVAGGLNRLGLLSDKLFRFVHLNLDTLEKRQLVYHVWLIYRQFFPNQAELGATIRNYGIKCAIIFGRYDSIIPPRLGEKFVRKFGESEWFFEIELGHRLIEPRIIPFIQERNLWP